MDLSRLYAIHTWRGSPTPPAARGTTNAPRVLRPDGQPIPGLYAAGAVSLVWGT